MVTGIRKGTRAGVKLGTTWMHEANMTLTVTGPGATTVSACHMAWGGTANETWGSSGAYSEDGSSTSWYSSYDETNDATDPPTVVAAENTSGGTTTGTPPTVPENPGQSGGEVYWNVPDDWWERQRHLRELAEQAYQDLEHRDDYVDAAFAELNALSDPDTPTASVMQTLGEPTSGRPVYQPSGVASVPNNGQSRAGAFAAGMLYGAATAGWWLTYPARWFGVDFSAQDAALDDLQSQLFGPGDPTPAATNWVAGGAACAAFGAVGAALWGAVGGGQFAVGIGPGAGSVPIHFTFGWGTAGTYAWGHGVGSGLFTTTVGAGPGIWRNITGIPIIAPSAIGAWVATQPQGGDCFCAVMAAFGRSFQFWR